MNLFHEEVAERVDFIKFINSILAESEKVITTKLLSDIWKDIVEDPFEIEERNLLYKWFCQLANEKGSIVYEVASFFKQ